MMVRATSGQGYGRPLAAGGRRGRHGLGNQWVTELHYLFVSSVVTALQRILPWPTWRGMRTTGFGIVLLGNRFALVLTACRSCCGPMLGFWKLPTFVDEVRNA